jgi:tetratricopeptide (TPR) repeat protein
MAMQMLPEDEWSRVVANYSQLYGNVEDFTNQLKVLEKARTDKPNDPALRFLLGYEFGFLGYPQQAVTELDKALDLAPDDLGSEKLRDKFALAAGLPARPHPPRDQAPAGQGGAPAPGAPALGTPQPPVPQPPIAQPPAAQPPAATPATPQETGGEPADSPVEVEATPA